VRNSSVWQQILGVTRTVIERVEFDDELDAVVVSVRPNKAARRRCGRCGKRASWYDRGEGRRRWRGLDLGEVRVFLEADAPRVSCPTHGVTVVQVPWARHNTGHTYAFDDTVAWLVVQCSKSALVELLRIAWRTVGAIITRVQADIDATVDRFADLRRIGIDEISYTRGHRYLSVIVDHDTGRLVWAGVGRTEKTLAQFFELLGIQRCGEITHVSADSAEWITKTVTRYCPHAIQCADPFHVVRWATNALDEVRRQVWNEARGATQRRHAGRSRGDALKVKRSRFVLWKNPEHLTDTQRAKLEWIAKTNPRLYRAYLLKEGLRLVFQLEGDQAHEALDHWIGWARRSRIPAFIALQRKIAKHRAAIDATLEHGLSNALTESMNAKIRVLTRIAYGFRNPNALIALALLAHGGHRPALPGRA
jgi:transposase